MRPISERLDNPNVKVINYKDYTGEFIFDEISNYFFKDLEEIKNHYINLDLPRYIYGTKLVPMRLDLDYILQNTYEDCTDDIEGFIEDSLNGVEELKDAVNKFNEKNKHIKGYYVADFNVIVKLKEG